MALQPQLKSSQLIEELDRLTSAGQLDELTISRFLREAEKIRSADPLGAAMLAGALAIEKGDVAEMERQYQIAFGVAPGSESVRANYANCLFQFGFLTRAKDEMIRSHRLAPGNRGILARAADFAVCSFSFGEALHLVEKLRLLGDSSRDYKVASLENMAEFLAENPGLPAEIQRLESIMGEVLRASHKLLFRVQVSLMSDDESEWLSAWWHVITMPGEIADLNWILAGKEAQVPFHPEISLRVNMMFVSMAPA